MQMLADATKQFAFTDLEESSYHNDALSLYTNTVILECKLQEMKASVKMCF